MMKLKRYLKPYLGLLAAAIVLLFGQAVLDLNLPNLMSDIVNVGIQQGGITEAAPKAVSNSTLQMMTMFMSKEDAALAARSYVPADKSAMTDKEWDVFVKQYPAAENGGVFRQDPAMDQAQNDALQAAFGRASYALVNFLKEMSTQSEIPAQAGDTAGAAMDITQLEAMLPLFLQEQQRIDSAVAMAAVTPESMLSQTATVFTKGIYRQLGTDTDSIQTQYIFKTGAKMLLFSLLVVLCAVGVGFCASRLGAGVARDLRRAVFTKVSSFTNNEFDQFSTASLITRTTNDVTQVQMFLTMGLRMVCYAPIMGIGGTIMALEKSTSMAWIIAAAVVVMLGMIMIIFSVAMPKFKRMQTLVDKLNLVSRENLTGIMVIRAFATQKFEEDRFDKANRDLAFNTRFTNRVIVTMMPIMMLIMNGVSLLIVWIGGHQIAESAMQVGDMMAFMQYSMQIIMSFLMISMMFIMIPRASVSGDRIAEVLSCESSVKDPKAPQALPAHVKGVVEFNDVSFRYQGADEDVLEHISFTARPGETTAFIGSTGSGKSTLINLIPRFYDVSEGSITLDGVDIRSVRQKELRSVIGYVPQKGVLFSGDINSNLRYGDQNADAQTLQKAAEVAQAMEFIDNLDKGFETPISQGGTNVSGGQRQRLSIARALVKKAPIYIFDDTFSALDFKTDAKLRKALKNYTENATTFIVAQRVSSIMHAEQIVVLDEGRVAGIGTHKELLQTCPTYREIAQSQLSKEELA